MPYIKQDFIERILQESSLLDVVESYTSKAKKSGQNFFVNSPFTNENTPSFCIKPKSNRFVDYSSQKSGDVITFIMEKENVPYPEAIELLARRLGYPIEYEDEEWAKQKEEKQKHRDSLRPLLSAAHHKYIEELKKIFSSGEDHPAYNELKKRGYSAETIADWQIGFAPGERFIYEHLKKLNRLKDGTEVFLVGEKFDKYWNRIVYPIHDHNGLLIGFAGRDVSNQKQKRVAKWLNPNDNILYSKNKTWFGLHRAKEAIHKTGEAWILEGQPDVVAWHVHGLENSIAPCGTSITESQVRILKRYCKKVVLCLDPDAAGNKAVIRNLPIFIAEGFEVDVVYLPDGHDPDEYTREFAKEIKSEGLQNLMNADGNRRNGFTQLLNHYIHGNMIGSSESNTSQMEKAKGANDLLSIVATVTDEYMQEVYLGWISKEAGLARNKIDKWFKDHESRVSEERVKEHKYNLPKGVDKSLKEVLPDIEKYGLFMANDQIYMVHGTDNEHHYNFQSVSNFSVEIIQHMQDEKFPMKLVKIRNTSGDEKIFDTMSENLNTPMAFDNTVTAHGNYLWTGGRNEFQKLRRYLFDNMGVGQKIEVLGWQPQGFWVWNNGISIPGKGTEEIDQNGVYKMKEKENRVDSYYIPSANKIYHHNDFKFVPQKKVVLVDSDFDFTSYTNKVIEVHRHHGITSILFTIASMFLDIVEDKLGSFPLLFLYGPASSGKDQLIECTQSFFGDPQSPIHIGNKVSTAKAQIRKFAQFRNMIVHLSEYRPGDQQLDEILKGFWDRRGYERGSIESAFATDVIPINSSVIFTGNHYPMDDALITRCITEEMLKTDFTSDEKKAYQQLKDMNKAGFSKFTVDFLEHRNIWADSFKEKFRTVERHIKREIGGDGGYDRMFQNIAVLGASYELMKDKVQFPFTYQQFIAHVRVGLESQLRKLKSASITMKWWDCFLSAVRTKTDPLTHGKEFELKDNKLYMNYTHCYNRIALQWWAQHHEMAASKSKMADTLKDDPSFIQVKNSHRMREIKSSVWVLDLVQLPVFDDLQEAVEWQKLEGKDHVRPAHSPENSLTRPDPTQKDLFNNPAEKGQEDSGDPTKGF